MEIHYSQHFLERQHLRNFAQGLAEEVFSHADEHFYDSLTSNYIAVKRRCYSGDEKDLALAYLKVGQDVIFITIHPLKEGQKERRIQSRRWIPYEYESSL